MTVVAEIKTDVGSLAWVADHAVAADLTRREYELLEGVGRWLEEVLPLDDDGNLIEGEGDVTIGDPEDEQRLEELERWGEGVLGRLAEMGVELGHDPEEGVTVDELAAAVQAALERERAEGVKDATIPSRAGTAERKAMRLLVERRVEIVTVDRARKPTFVHARVRGDEGTYDCGFHPVARAWRCTCANPRGGCSHIAAVKMIVPLDG